MSPLCYLHLKVFIPECQLDIGTPVTTVEAIVLLVSLELFSELSLFLHTALILWGVWLWYSELINDPDSLHPLASPVCCNFILLEAPLR